jgi:hypothetical protein
MLGFKHFILFILLFAMFKLEAQFHPPAGQLGTSAMHADSSAFIAWASSCAVQRGLIQWGLDSLGFVDTGLDEYGTGKALSNPTVSLGDGGQATLTFPYPISNEEGWDFAVFENSFDGMFLELAFVEVSSDGENFVRFPATTLSDSNWTVGPFDFIDAHLINNLAGKYAIGYGTPFDLQELADSSTIDINSITHVRVVDVIGTPQSDICSRDQFGNPILDPFPTPFPGCGFDLDAVGVIHHLGPNSIEEAETKLAKIYPQPATGVVNIELQGGVFEKSYIELYTLSGNLISQVQIQVDDESLVKLDISGLKSGIYILKIINRNHPITSRLSVVN